MSDTLKLGQIITEDQQKDAIHIAVAPVVAAQVLTPGDHVGFQKDGRVGDVKTPIGVVDPFLTVGIKENQKFWLFLYPGSITSLKHEWTHPAFEPVKEDGKSFSEKWMRRWAIKNMGEDYYNDGGPLKEDVAFRQALDAGRQMSVGPYESARDEINDEWWSHWETITGQKGNREEYFSCAC